jgi:hypothetical protein
MERLSFRPPTPIMLGLAVDARGTKENANKETLNLF